jgi:hypothetical protein
VTIAGEQFDTVIFPVQDVVIRLALPELMVEIEATAAS